MFSLLAMAGALLLGREALGQDRPGSGLPNPRLLVVSPCGAKAGATVEISCYGLHLEEPEKLVFSAPGIKAEKVVDPPLPIDPKTKKPIIKPGVTPPNPQVPRFKVTVPAGAAVGIGDMRLVNKWGVSNPRAFVVGDLDEVAEKEPNNDVEQAQKVAINSTINGAIANATDVDYYVFTGKKGQRVVISCLATSIDSRLQPAIELFDADEKQLASNRNYKNWDALTDCTLPSDGDYYVRVYQFTHTFRPGLPLPQPLPAGAFDYFYRLTITTAPWIDSIHPCVVEPGKTTNVTVYGRNLPGGKLDPAATVDDVALEKATAAVAAPTLAEAEKKAFTGMLSPSAATVDGFEFRLRNPIGASNPFLLGLAKAPVIIDNEKNDTPETAQAITLPCEIAGLVEKRRDRDWYSFDAEKGDAFTIEVISSRLGAPTYMSILLRNATSKADIYETPFNDNMGRQNRKFLTRSEDPQSYRFVAPAKGKYLLLATSRAAGTQYGVRHTYAVRIAKQAPDFRLVALAVESNMPTAPLLYQGGEQALTVLAWRNGDFTGPIELSVEGLPAGVTCTAQPLAGQVRQTTLVLSAAATAAAWTGEIKIKGTATMDGKAVTHEARAGVIVWPVQQGQNTPNLSRFERSTHLAVRGKAPFRLTTSLDKTTVVQGDKATLKVAIDRLWPEFKGPLQIQTIQSPQQQGLELPNNLRVNNFGPINVNPAQKEASLPITIGQDVPPGVYNIVLRGQGQMPYNKDPMAKAKPNTFLVQPSTSITLAVLPKLLAVVNLNNTNPTVKAGGQIEVVVQVQRRFGYTGEFKVSLVLPPGVTGVQADELTIPAGANQAKWVIKAPAGTPPGNRANLTARVVALYNGKTPITHEVKLNVNVVK
jgi:hypothetical protein